MSIGSFNPPDSAGTCCACREDPCTDCLTCSVTYQTRSIVFAKQGYNGKNFPVIAGVHHHDTVQCGGYAMSTAEVSASCPPPGGTADTAARWYHRRWFCWIGKLGEPLPNSYSGAGFCMDWGGYAGDGCQTGDSANYGAQSRYTQSTTDFSAIALPENSTVDPQTGIETMGATENVVTGAQLLCFYWCDTGGPDTPTCEGAGPCAAGWEASNGGWDGHCYQLVPAFGNPNLAMINGVAQCDLAEVGGSWLGAEIDWYYDQPYSDEEMMGYARTALNAETWGPCSSACMASIAFTGGAGIDHTDVNITDLKYTITPSTDGATCYWTLRFTDAGGGIHDTAMSGSGTFTIIPDAMGTLTYDSNSNYSSGAGTWQVINLSGQAP